MGLTHVCIWKDKNWKRISAYEASKLYPNGRPAHSQTFVCELCNQYVTFVRGSVMIPHFRHNSKEENKECEDRREIYSQSNVYSNLAKGLPLKLVFDESDGIKYKIGFTPLPDYILKSMGNYKLTITGVETFNYNISRIGDTLTYLDVGSVPSQKYKIVVSPRIDRINGIWPDEVLGVSFDGTLFDKQTGKKLPYDADVQVNKEYYILSLYKVGNKCNDVEIKEVFFDKKNRWRITKVKAKDYTETAAKFFLRYHCRLTIKPVSLYPIWPEYIESPYLVSTNKNNIYFAIEGRIDRIEPLNKVKSFPYIEPYKMLSVSCETDQINLSVGRLGVLRYLGVRKTELDNNVLAPDVQVFDVNGELLSQGEQFRIPYKKTINILAKYDGFVEIISEKKYSKRISIKSNEKTEIDDINFGKHVKIYQGLDKVWDANYIHTKNNSNDETELLNMLLCCDGRKIPINHTFGAIIEKFKDMPKIKLWIYKNIKEGYIDEKALKILKRMLWG